MEFYQSQKASSAEEPNQDELHLLRRLAARGDLSDITAVLRRLPWQSWAPCAEVAALLHRLAWLLRGEDRFKVASHLARLGKELQGRKDIDPLIAYTLVLDAVVLGPETKDSKTFAPVFTIMEDLLENKHFILIAHFWSQLARRSLDTTYLEVGYLSAVRVTLRAHIFVA